MKQHKGHLEHVLDMLRKDSQCKEVRRTLIQDGERIRSEQREREARHTRFKQRKQPKKKGGV